MPWVNKYDAQRLTGRSQSAIRRWRIAGWVKVGKTAEGKLMYDQATLLKAASMARERVGNHSGTPGTGRGNRGRWTTTKGAEAAGMIPLPFDEA